MAVHAPTHTSVESYRSIGGFQPGVRGNDASGCKASGRGCNGCDRNGSDCVRPQTHRTAERVGDGYVNRYAKEKPDGYSQEGALPIWFWRDSRGEYGCRPLTKVSVGPYVALGHRARAKRTVIKVYASQTS